jgi:hypothetical protein
MLFRRICEGLKLFTLLGWRFRPAYRDYVASILISKI